MTLDVFQLMYEILWIETSCAEKDCQLHFVGLLPHIWMGATFVPKSEDFNDKHEMLNVLIY